MYRSVEICKDQPTDQEALITGNMLRRPLMHPLYKEGSYAFIRNIPYVKQCGQKKKKKRKKIDAKIPTENKNNLGAEIE